MKKLIYVCILSGLVTSLGAETSAERLRRMMAERSADTPTEEPVVNPVSQGGSLLAERFAQVQASDSTAQSTPPTQALPQEEFAAEAPSLPPEPTVQSPTPQSYMPTPSEVAKVAASVGSVVTGEPKFETVGDATLIGPSFLDGWAVVDLKGYAFREGVDVGLANGQTYKFGVTGFLLTPREDTGKVLINENVLPAVNTLIVEQRRLVKDIRRMLADRRPLEKNSTPNVD